MHHIIFTALLLVAQSCLFAMELVPFPPSNSSSEMYFLVTNIDHNLFQHYHLDKDAKKELLKLYIAVTNDERAASRKYDGLIDIPDYMSLNKHNKCYIQELFSTNTPMRIEDISNKKMIVLTTFPDAQTDYQKMLKLPQNIRRKIAARYSPMIIATRPEHGMNQQQATTKEIIEIIKSGSRNAGIIAATTTILDYFLFIAIPDPLFVIPLVSVMVGLEVLVLTKVIHAAIYPLTKELKYRYHNGYQLQPLLPEDNNK